MKAVVCVKYLIAASVVLVASLLAVVPVYGQELPGCPGTDSTTKENCTYAQELINIYNGTVQNDTSLQALGGPDGSNAMCIQQHKDSLRTMAQLYEKKYKQLKAKGDANAGLDAVKPYVITMRNIENTYQRCLKAPKHKIKTPGPGGH